MDKAVEIITRNTKQMQALINDLLDISIIESGSFELHLASEDLAVLARELLDFLSLTVEDKDISVRLDRPELPKVRIDRERMAQVIDNLLTNAFTFSQPETTVEVRAREESGKRTPAAGNDASLGLYSLII